MVKGQCIQKLAINSQMTATSVTVSCIEQLVYWLPKRTQRDKKVLVIQCFCFYSNDCVPGISLNQWMSKKSAYIFTHGMRVLMDDNCVLEFLILPTCSMNLKLQ